MYLTIDDIDEVYYIYQWNRGEALNVFKERKYRMIKKIIKNIGHSLHGIEIVNFVDIKLLYMFGTKDSFFLIAGYSHLILFLENEDSVSTPMKIQMNSS